MMPMLSPLQYVVSQMKYFNSLAAWKRRDEKVQ